MSTAFLDAFDAILLDMDGTLVDSEELWFASGQAVSARFGVDLPHSAGEVLHGLGQPAPAGVRDHRHPGVDAGLPDADHVRQCGGHRLAVGLIGGDEVALHVVDQQCRPTRVEVPVDARRERTTGNLIRSNRGNRHMARLT